ncbi:4-hydroxythreonine-4-phosphate dehydrogenase [Phycisphaerae bacterium]|nr:4-hydroxythreonine-4-phosphate dehydrogenase [Phycisphaerae bacterium]
MKPLVSISMGDPAGIGPEVIVKALGDDALRGMGRWVICGNAMPLQLRLQQAGLKLVVRHATLADVARDDAAPGDGEVVLLREEKWEGVAAFDANSAQSGAASLAYVERAIALARDESVSEAWRASAIATGPISKEAWFAAGQTRYPGHTELFAERFGSEKFAMMFAAEPRRDLIGGASSGLEGAGLHCVLVTAHVPVREVANVLTTPRVLDVIVLANEAMQGLGFASPRIGVCGLNPHAGERGILGSEDDAIIRPAVEAARGQGVNVSGPWSGDTIFQGALASDGKPARDFDLVVAMYHDQGLIPVKLLAWDRAVNMTIGLTHRGRRVLRTSPDHGTAFAIAGKNCADPGSMAAALRMAAVSGLRTA